MFSHEVGELVPFEGLIDNLDQLWVLLFFFQIFLFILDIKHPLAVILKLCESRVYFPIPLLFLHEILLKHEVFDGGL
jgi:hypothetical protein